MMKKMHDFAIAWAHMLRDDNPAHQYALDLYLQKLPPFDTKAK